MALSALVVKQDTIIVRVSKRKYRIARMMHDGTGYSNISGGNTGLTNIREYEFISDPLTFSEVNRELYNHTTGKKIEYRNPWEDSLKGN